MTEHRAYDDIRSERARQDETWGRQRHTWPEWMTILTEEIGEAARAANQAHWARSDGMTFDEAARDRLDRMTALRLELVQSAAVAVAIIEHIDDSLGGQS
jgi:NTP pyrophosphatase (non-canonical NTP hydrolase)